MTQPIPPVGLRQPAVGPVEPALLTPAEREEERRRREERQRRKRRAKPPASPEDGGRLDVRA